MSNCLYLQRHAQKCIIYAFDVQFVQYCDVFVLFECTVSVQCRFTIAVSRQFGWGWCLELQCSFQGSAEPHFHCWSDHMRLSLECYSPHYHHQKQTSLCRLLANAGPSILCCLMFAGTTAHLSDKSGLRWGQVAIGRAQAMTLSSSETMWAQPRFRIHVAESSGACSQATSTLMVLITGSASAFCSRHIGRLDAVA